MAQARTKTTHRNGSKARRDALAAESENARNIHIKFLVNGEEHVMLKDMSKRTGLRVSDLLRQIIRIASNDIEEDQAKNPGGKVAILGRSLS